MSIGFCLLNSDNSDTCTYIIVLNSWWGDRAWGGDLIVFVGPGVGHLTDLVLPGKGIFESFFARRGDIWLPTRTKKTGTEHMFPTSTLHTYIHTHAPYGQERSGNYGGQREQAKAGWIPLFCLQISFVLVCFWSIEPLKILLHQSKWK